MRNSPRLLLTKRAEGDLRKLPRPIQPNVAAALDTFGQNPTAKYRRSVVPAEKPGYLLHEIGPIKVGTTDYLVKVFFHLSPDGKSAIIKFVGYVPYQAYQAK